MPTIEQIRAARALIGWSQGKLAEHSGMSQTGIARIENGTNHPNSTTLEKIERAFDKADIEFIGQSGVKKRTGEIQKLQGKKGLMDFMDDVYETANTVGGQMSFYNIVPQNWLDSLGSAWWQMHVARMAECKNKTNVRILVPENNTNFISTRYADYKWFPGDIKLSDKKSLYIYGGKIGFVAFNHKTDDIDVLILKNQEFAIGVQALFDIAWTSVAKTPD